jgi:hypothetical protein
VKSRLQRNQGDREVIGIKQMYEIKVQN